MPQFIYKARDRSGTALSGTVEASTEEAVQNLIREKDLILLSIKKVSESVLIQKLRSIGQGVKIKDIVVFSRQLAVLISATVPIVRALRILSNQTESKVLQRAVTSIADDVDGGTRLSAAMYKYQRIFDDFFVHMVRAGETTGRLDEVLVYLADQKEKDYELISKVISSMIYPIFIFLVLIAVFIFMMIYVVPKLLNVVLESGAELPLVTKILVGISNFMQTYWWLILALILGGIIGYGALKARPFGKRLIDRAKLRLPVIGKIFRKLYLARMSRSLSNLLAAGVPVNRSIEIVSDVVGNYLYKNVMLDALKDVEAGHSLSSSLSKSEDIPQMMTQMMLVGEETGRMDQILEKVADFYMNEVNSLTQALVSLVEPLVIILLGGGALILVSGILMPIYSITSQF